MDDKGKALLREERKHLTLKKDRLLAEMTQFRDEISQIREEVVQIQDSIDAINLLVGDETPHRPFKLTSKKGIKTLPVISIVATILRDTAEPMDVAAIMKVLRECDLDEIKEATVRSALVRLSDQPSVNRVERGVYQIEKSPSQQT